jgi:hypothetical protein
VRRSERGGKQSYVRTGRCGCGGAGDCAPRGLRAARFIDASRPSGDVRADRPPELTLRRLRKPARLPARQGAGTAGGACALPG